MCCLTKAGVIFAVRGPSRVWVSKPSRGRCIAPPEGQRSPGRIVGTSRVTSSQVRSGLRERTIRQATRLHVALPFPHSVGYSCRMSTRRNSVFSNQPLCRNQCLSTVPSETVVAVTFYSPAKIRALNAFAQLLLSRETTRKTEQRWHVLCVGTHIRGRNQPHKICTKAPILTCSFPALPGVETAFRFGAWLSRSAPSVVKYIRVYTTIATGFRTFKPPPPSTPPKPSLGVFVKL